MKVLWFTNRLIPQACAALGITPESHSGGWMGALFQAFRQRHPGVQMCVASTDVTEARQEVTADAVTYIRIPRGAKAEDEAAGVVRDFAPDLVHVHGTEDFYGLVAGKPGIRCPFVVSLQGLLGPYTTWPGFFGNHTPLQVLRLHRVLELAKWSGLIPTYVAFRRFAVRERQILANVQHVMGRTQWDRDFALGMNPRLSYHHVGELLRDEFWRASWDLQKCKRFSIAFTNAGHPRKGAEVLLDAFRIVRREYPTSTLRLAGWISKRNGYGRYIRRRAGEFAGAVELVGALNGREIADMLLDSHVFASPSFSDNSPNALCEAQLLGLPVVSTYCGGVPSLVENGRTGLFSIVGDAPSLAGRIVDVFREADLAVSLGCAAQAVARNRHDPDLVVQQLMRAYENIVDTRKGN